MPLCGPILWVKTCEIFQWAENQDWAECGNILQLCFPVFSNQQIVSYLQQPNQQTNQPMSLSTNRYYLSLANHPKSKDPPIASIIPSHDLIVQISTVSPSLPSEYTPWQYKGAHPPHSPHTGVHPVGQHVQTKGKNNWTGWKLWYLVFNCIWPFISQERKS